MRWTTLLVVASLITPAIGSAVAGTAAAAIEEPPESFSPTARSLYALTFVAGDGIAVANFVRRVPAFGVIHQPDQIVSACERLGFQAEHERAIWNDLLGLDELFLAPDQSDHWKLYRMTDGNVRRIEVPSLEEVPVSGEEFRSEWNQEIIVVTAIPSPGGAHSEIRLDHMEHDFGTVREGQKVSHLFPFQNVGSATLEITRVKPGCGCSQVVIGLAPEGGVLEESDIEWEAKRFPPGAHGVAKFVYNSKGRRGPTASYAEIDTNDPGNRRFRFVVKVNVKVPVDVTPVTAGFGFVSADSLPAKTIQIAANEEADFEILQATATSPRVRINYSPNTPSPPDVVAYVLQIALDLEGLEPDARIQDTVLVRTNSKWKPEIEIPVSAIVKPPVYPTPDVMRLVRHRRDGNPTGYLVVVNGSGVKADLVNVTSDIEDLDIQWRDIGRGRKQVVAELKTDGEPGELSGTVTIRTTHPEVEKIEVPVTYTPVRRP